MDDGKRDDEPTFDLGRGGHSAPYFVGGDQHHSTRTDSNGEPVFSLGDEPVVWRSAAIDHHPASQAAFAFPQPGAGLRGETFDLYQHRPHEQAKHASSCGAQRDDASHHRTYSSFNSGAPSTAAAQRRSPHPYEPELSASKASDHLTAAEKRSAYSASSTSSLAAASSRPLFPAEGKGLHSGSSFDDDDTSMDTASDLPPTLGGLQRQHSTGYGDDPQNEDMNFAWGSDLDSDSDFEEDDVESDRLARLDQATRALAANFRCDARRCALRIDEVRPPALERQKACLYQESCDMRCTACGAVEQVMIYY